MRDRKPHPVGTATTLCTLASIVGVALAAQKIFALTNRTTEAVMAVPLAVWWLWWHGFGPR
jgi:hypothetical protein